MTATPTPPLARPRTLTGKPAQQRLNAHGHDTHQRRHLRQRRLDLHRPQRQLTTSPAAPSPTPSTRPTRRSWSRRTTSPTTATPTPPPHDHRRGRRTAAAGSSVTLNTTHTDAGTYSDSWSFTGRHQLQQHRQHDHHRYHRQGQRHGCGHAATPAYLRRQRPHATVTVTGVGSDGQLSRTSFSGTDARHYSLPWCFCNGNYESSDESGTLAFDDQQGQRHGRGHALQRDLRRQRAHRHVRSPAWTARRGRRSAASR